MKPRGGGGGDRAVRKGPWTAEEDEVLRQHVREHGPREWSSIRSKGLLPRTGKSCRLRWVNKLRPNLKTGCKFSSEEERVVIDLQAQFGNKWARIATYLPGRTDNDVKNFWSTRQKRLARILRAPLHRRRPAVAKQNGGRASSAPSHDLPSPKACTFHPIGQDGACFDMTPFQAATHDDIGQSSQEPCIENQCAGAPFPGSLDPESILPSSMGMAVECGGSYSAATVAHMSYLYSGDAAPMVDPAGLAGVASLGDDVAYLQERKPVVQPPQFFGLEEDVFGHVGPARRGMPDVLFDDLPPEMFDFFEQPPPSPSPSPLPPAASRQL